MELVDCTLIYIAAAIVFPVVMIYTVKRKGRSIQWVACALLLTLAVINYIDFYFVPFPLNYAGLTSSSDPLISMKNAFFNAPFYTTGIYIRHGEFVSYLQKFVIQNAICGVSLGIVLPLCNRRLRHILPFVVTGMVITLFPYGFYIVIKLLSGYVIRRVDVTELIIFAVCYIAGGLVSFALCNNAKTLVGMIDRKEDVHERIQEDEIVI